MSTSGPEVRLENLVTAARERAVRLPEAERSRALSWLETMTEGNVKPNDLLLLRFVIAFKLSFAEALSREPIGWALISLVSQAGQGRVLSPDEALDEWLALDVQDRDVLMIQYQAFSREDPDEPVARPCVGSGFCCKKVPCPYGERAPDTGWCIHLTPWEGDDLGVPRYRCGRYEFISKQPGAEYVPAFGAGCCSPLFNEDRDRIVRALRVVR